MTTTDDQYVPTEEDMEERYVRHSLALVDFPRGDRPEWEQKLREEFRRGLARVRRDAWDACYHQMVTAPARGGALVPQSNPYAPERRETP